MLLADLRLDRASDVPLVDQAETQVRSLLASGRLPAGTRLPSIRALSARLGVSVNTVVTLYDRLAARALIESRGTAGFSVAARPQAATPQAAIDAGEEQDALWLAQQAHNLHAAALPASGGALPPAWLADAVPASLVQRAIARSAHGMASRCPPQGLPELRERLALLMQGQGLPVTAGQVMTTWGGAHAIDLICRAFLQPGDAVLVEDPGYFLLFSRLREAQVRMIPIRRHPEGVDLEQVDAACREQRPKLMFVQSVIHNPTGWGSSAANLHRLLGIADRHGMLVAEDDVHGHFHAGHAARLASLSALQGVLYFSSLSKALSPALRIGYLAAEPQYLKLLLRQKIVSLLTTAALNELVLAELLANGRVRKHIDRLQQRLQTARGITTRGLEAAGLHFEPGGSGLFLWGCLPAGTDAAALVRDAYQDGFLLSRGGAFTVADAADDPHIRFNVVFGQDTRLHAWLAARLQVRHGGTVVPLVRRG